MNKHLRKEFYEETGIQYDMNKLETAKAYTTWLENRAHTLYRPVINHSLNCNHCGEAFLDAIDAQGHRCTIARNNRPIPNFNVGDRVLALNEHETTIEEVEWVPSEHRYHYWYRNKGERVFEVSLALQLIKRAIQ